MTHAAQRLRFFNDSISNRKAISFRMWIELIIRSATLGVTASILPGPQQTFAINSALTYGWRRSASLVFAPLVADTPVIILTLFFLRQFPPVFLSTLYLIGGLFILYLAWKSYASYRAGATIGGSTTDAAPRHLFRQAVLMNLLGPGPYIFWSTIHGPTVLESAAISIWLAIAYVVTFYLVFALCIGITLVVFDRLRSLNPTFTRRIILASIVVLALFGLSLLWRGVESVAVLFSNPLTGVH